MDVRAAVAFGPGKPLEVTSVKLDGPRAGEVLVEIKATPELADLALVRMSRLSVLPVSLPHWRSRRPASAIPTSSRCRAPTLRDFFPRSSATRAPASSSTSDPA